MSSTVENKTFITDTSVDESESTNELWEQEYWK